MKKVKFGISDSSTIINILRNKLYSHPLRTAIQEYLSNARDAHREAGVTNNLLITSPQDADPYFRVRDFGCGISPERMVDVFVKYGGTTKKNDEGQTGGFGIGAKSAWGYTSDFFIKTFIGGVETTYKASISEECDGELNEVARGITTEDNGTEIYFRIDSYDFNKVAAAIFRTTFYWEEDVTVIGADKNDFDLDNIKINTVNYNEDFFRVSRQFNSYLDIDNQTVLVDGIPFKANLSNMPILKDLYNKLDNAYYNTDFFKVDKIWGVEIAANREGISDNSANIKLMEELAQAEIERIDMKIVNDWSGVNSVTDLIKFKHAHKGLIMSERIWNDYQIRSNNSLVGKNISKLVITRIRMKNDFVKKTNAYSIPIDLIGHSVFVKDVDESVMKFNRRVRQFFIDSDLDSFYVIEKRECEDSTNFTITVNELKAKNVSELTLKPNAKRDKSDYVKRDVNELPVFLYKIKGDCGNHKRSRRVLNLEDLPKDNIYIYFDQKLEKSEGETFLHHYANFLRKDNTNYRFITMVTSRIKKIDGHEQFVNITDFIENYKLSGTALKNYMLNALPQIHDLSDIESLIKRMAIVSLDRFEKIKNDDMKKHGKLLSIIEDYNNSYNHIPNRLYHKIPNHFVIAKNAIKKMFENGDRFNKDYALLNHINICSDDLESNKNLINDVVDYINKRCC